MARAVRRVSLGSVRPAFVVLALLALALTIRLGVGVITEEGDSRDARHHVAAGMTLARDGVFGYDAAEGPNMYREPLTSWTIAIQAVLDPRLRGLTFADVDRPGQAARAVKQQNLVWAFGLLLGIGRLTLVVQRGHGRRQTLVAAAAMLVTHVAFLEWEDVVDRSLSELAAAAILVWASVAAVRLVDEARPRTAMMLGVLLGLLALTKASFLYVAIVFVLLLALFRWGRSRGSARIVLRDTTLVLLGLTLACGPWMGRNLHQFGSFGIADRGGLAIWFRVNWNEATGHELRGAWVYFAPQPLQAPAARLLDIDLEDFEGDGALRRVARGAEGEEEDGLSFYRVSRRLRAELTEEYRATGLYTEWQAAHLADRDLMRLGVRALRDDPSRFLRTFPVFLWRGTWPMLYSNVLPSVLLGPLNLGGMALLMFALGRSVVMVRPRLFAFVALAGGLVVFYASLSHFEARQTRPAVPVMLLLCVLAIDAAVRRVRDDWDARRSIN